MPQNDTDFDQLTFNAYKARLEIYKMDLLEFEQQNKHSGTSQRLSRRLWPRTTSHSSKQTTRILGTTFGHSREDWPPRMERDVSKLSRGTTSSAEAQDFLMAIWSKDTLYADARLVAIESQTTGDLYKQIDSFRQHLQRQQLYEVSGKAEHSAFNATFRGQACRPPKPCLYGDRHWIADCYYLVPDRRPTGWTPNPTKQKKVDDAMNSDRKRTWVETCLQRRKVVDNRSSTNNTQAPQTPQKSSPSTRSTTCTGWSSLCHLFCCGFDGIFPQELLAFGQWD
ncbi:hypothetical protein MMC07_004574 [Pseudocyphellaria aurata]|nr:hypothetical protein [Pseudocyphellaria aurata]